MTDVTTGRNLGLHLQLCSKGLGSKSPDEQNDGPKCSIIARWPRIVFCSHSVIADVRPFRGIMRFTLFGMIALLTGCSMYPPAADDAPIDDGWQPANGAIVEPIDTEPKVTIIGRSGSDVTIQITNIGTESLEYGSRDDDSITRFREVEKNGKWTFDTYDWCGMGVESRQLEPGQSITVLLKFDLPLKRERILGAFSQKGTEKHS